MLKVSNLTKGFEDKEVLTNVSFEVNEGSIYGIVGTNGAGKSTLLRMLSGVYKADNGSILFDEDEVYDNPSAKGKIFFVADDMYYEKGSSISDMAKIYSAYYKTFSMKKFDTLIELYKFDKKKVLSKMSKGMKRQAALILALSVGAKYLLFDEAFDGLDPVIRSLTKQLIIKDVEENNTTVILTSHSLRELEDLCDNLAAIHQNQLIFTGEVNDLKTSQFKIQLAFKDEYDESKFEGINISKFEKNGSVASMIVTGDREEIDKKITAMNPAIYEILPLNLEEVFVSKMGDAGYKFDISVLDEEV